MDDFKKQFEEVVELKNNIEIIEKATCTFKGCGEPRIAVSYSSFFGGADTYQLNLPENMNIELNTLVIEYLYQQRDKLVNELNKYNIHKD